jgi:integration host factor subunit beta
MIKSELIKSIAKKLIIFTERDIELSINHILNRIAEALYTGNRVEIRGFGGFTLRYRPPRNAHNPKTCIRVITLPKYVPHFKPGKDLRDRVNASRHLPIMKELREQD